MKVWVTKKLVDDNWVPVSVSFDKDELERAVAITRRYFGGEFKIVPMHLEGE